MKPRPPIMESWWPGLLGLLVWSILIVTAFIGCQRSSAQDNLTATPVLQQAVTLVWKPNDPSETIEFYRVWRGLELLGQTTETTLKVELPTDQLSTLTVTAHRAGLSSPHSHPLVLAPAVVHTSSDLRVWVVERSSYFFQTLEREGAPVSRQFFRVQYHVPQPPPTPNP